MGFVDRQCPRDEFVAREEAITRPKIARYIMVGAPIALALASVLGLLTDNWTLLYAVGSFVAFAFGALVSYYFLRPCKNDRPEKLY